jgi:hypothetical protein
MDHPYLTRWRKVFAVGSIAGTVAADVTSYRAAGVVPKYLTSIDDVDYTPPGTVAGTEYDLMGRGALPYDGMGAPGEDVRQGVYPWYVPQWIVHRHAGDLEAALRNGDLAGSWPCHLNRSGDIPPSIDTTPTFWFDPAAKAFVGSGQAVAPLGDMSNLGIGRLSMDNAHTSSLSFFPYLVTGDRYYADEMRHWAAWVFASLSPGYRDQGGGVSQAIILPAAGQTRALAWGLRDTGQPAAYLPDSDPLRSYIASKVIANLDWMDADLPHGGLGSVLGIYAQPSGPSSLVGTDTSSWQLGYLVWAMEHLYSLGIAGVGSKGRTAEDRVATYVQQYFNNPGIMDPIYGCVLGRAHGSSGIGSGYAILGTGSPAGGTWVYYASLAAFYAAEIGPYTASLPTDYLNYCQGNAAVLKAGSNRGVSGCTAAYTWLTAHATGTFGATPDIQAYDASRPGFAIDLS